MAGFSVASGRISFQLLIRIPDLLSLARFRFPALLPFRSVLPSQKVLAKPHLWSGCR